MAWTKVRQIQNTGSGLPALGATFLALPAVGNLIIVSVSAWDAGSEPVMAEGSVLDNQGHGNYKLVSDQDLPGTFVRHSKHYMVVTASSGSFTVTVTTVGPSGPVISLQLEEWNHTAGVPVVASVLDGSIALSVTAGTVINSGSFAVSGTTDLIHASITSTISDPLYTPNGGLALTQEIEDNDATQEITSAAREVSGAGNYDGQFTSTITASGNPYNIIVAAFKTAAVTSAPVIIPSYRRFPQFRRRSS